MRIEYFRDELIGILKKREFSRLAFHKPGSGYRFAHCLLYAKDKADDIEIDVTAHDNTISEEMTDRMIDVPEHPEECIQRAYDWLSKQNLHDEWFTKPYDSPQELAKKRDLRKKEDHRCRTICSTRAVRCPKPKHRTHP